MDFIKKLDEGVEKNIITSEQKEKLIELFFCSNDESSLLTKAHKKFSVET